LSPLLFVIVMKALPASLGWRKGGNVTSTGWQITLCDPIWHVSSHSGETVCDLLYTSYLYLTVIREFRVTLPWKLSYADDLVVIAETEDDLIERLNEWKSNVVNTGTRVNMNKTKVYD